MSESDNCGGGVVASLTTSLVSRGTAPTVELSEGGGVCLVTAGGERRRMRQAGRRTPHSSLLLTNILPDEAVKGKHLLYMEIISPPQPSLTVTPVEVFSLPGGRGAVSLSHLCLD